MSNRKKFNLATKLLLIGTIIVISPFFVSTLLSLIFTFVPGGNISFIAYIDYISFAGLALQLAALILMYRFNTGTTYSLITFVFYFIAKIFFTIAPYVFPVETIGTILTLENIIPSLLEILYMYFTISGMSSYLYDIGEAKRGHAGRKCLSIFTTALGLAFAFSIAAYIFSGYSNTELLGSIFSIVSFVAHMAAYVVFLVFIIIASIREK